MSENIKVINNTNHKVNVKINDVNGIIQIVIDTPPRVTELRTLKPGDVFKKNDIEYIVCEQFADDTTAVVRKKCLENMMKFGENNNWKESQWRKYLNNEYLKEIENDFGADKIVEHDVNLTSLDGYDDYRTAIDMISAMDIDMYRKYHKYIGNTGIAHYLATPDSTPSGYGSSRVQYVDDCGDVYYCGCRWSRDVRPFFILKSNVFIDVTGNN